MAEPPHNADDAAAADKGDSSNHEEEDAFDSVDEEKEDDFDDSDDSLEDESTQSTKKSRESKLRSQRDKLEKLFNRLQSGEEPVTLRIHDVVIKGNKRTKESVIEAELESFLSKEGEEEAPATLQEILRAAGVAVTRLQGLGVFDSVNITLDAGPPELEGTANVIVEVVESQSLLSGEIGVFTRPEARSWSLEGSLKLKNPFGYADIWDGSLVYGWDQATEVSVGVALPRIRSWSSPVTARVSMLSKDWLAFSSYKETSSGFSLGLLSAPNHELDYSLMWRTLTDPTQMASRDVRRHLGHSLLSSLRYTFKLDRRNSPLRPTRGYYFSSSTQLAGLTPDHRSSRFLRQEFDFRFALPLGFYRAALNFGISAGFLLPLARGFLSEPSPLPDRFFIGGQSSPICSLAGPSLLLGFQSRGVGHTEARRETKDNLEGIDSETSPRRDALGGDLALTAFADLSFDLPLKLFRDAGIHAHAFACAGNLAKLSEGEYQNFSVPRFLQSLRSSAGVGIIVPTRLFRMEVNYCYILRQFEQDQGRTGIKFSFSSL
ncbi:Sorting and assembly machinery component 50-like protein [Drosera capensis]